jgi:TrmH family RNA methyltransferase
MITSFSNPLVKEIRKLRERKYRQDSGIFFIEGAKLVGELVNENWQIESLIVSFDLLKSEFARELVDDLKNRDISIIEVSADVFQHLSNKDGPQGIGSTARQIHRSIKDGIILENDLWIALDEVQDPGNLGTILRTSDAVGAKGVILLDHSTDPYDPAAIRASMGAFFSQKVIECTLSDFTEWKRKSNFKMIGTSGSSNQDYHSFLYPPSMILLMGSEREGLSPEHYAICDAVVKIPMVGKSDSLNLAIATGIVIYEIFNQHRHIPQI